ncbi:unknown [Firmicutes bacterium CAG:110]|nr:unknown [Firmicutes bacterium CAG:110]
MLEYFIYHYGTQIIAAILCAIFGCLGYARWRRPPQR